MALRTWEKRCGNQREIPCEAGEAFQGVGGDNWGEGHFLWDIFFHSFAPSWVGTRKINHRGVRFGFAPIGGVPIKICAEGAYPNLVCIDFLTADASSQSPLFQCFQDGGSISPGSIPSISTFALIHRTSDAGFSFFLNLP